MGLVVEQLKDHTHLTLKLKGILDYSTTNVIPPFLSEIEHIEQLVIDFKGLDFIDSTGIGSLLDAIYLSEEHGFTIDFTGVNDETREVFEIVGLYNILNVIQEEA